MELRRLQYFARIADDGSLTKAAGVLRVAQPALSRQLRLLEEELGVSLCVRTARGVRLTEEGEYLREAIAGPLRSLEFALQKVRALASGAHGNLVLGMPSSLGDVLATRLVLQLGRHYPDIKLQVVEGATGSLIEWLHRGIIDLALLEEASKDDRLEDIELFSEPLMVVGAPGSELQPDRPIPIARALRLPLILQSHHLGIRGTVNLAAVRARVVLAPAIEAYSTKLIMDLVEHGDGFALLPPLIFEQRRAEGKLVSAPIAPAALAFKVYLSAKRSAHDANQRLSDAILKTLRGLFEERAIGQGADRD